MFEFKLGFAFDEGMGASSDGHGLGDGLGVGIGSGSVSARHFHVRIQTWIRALERYPGERAQLLLFARGRARAPISMFEFKLGFGHSKGVPGIRRASLEGVLS
jgi:hypothetical protein